MTTFFLLFDFTFAKKSSYYTYTHTHTHTHTYTHAYTHAYTHIHAHIHIHIHIALASWFNRTALCTYYNN